MTRNSITVTPIAGSLGAEVTVSTCVPWTITTGHRSTRRSSTTR